MVVDANWGISKVLKIIRFAVTEENICTSQA